MSYSQALAPRLGLPGTRTETSYLPPADMTFDEWCSAVNTLRAMERSVKWWLGDALLFGTAAYGEDASQAFPDAYQGSPYAESTMRAAMWVSERFPRGTRVDGVTWTHHRVVAELPPREARALLLEAVGDPERDKPPLSTRELIALRDRRKEDLRGLAAGADDDGDRAPDLRVPQTSDLTDEARAALSSRLSEMGRRHQVGFEAGWLRALIWADALDAFRPECRP